MSEDMQMNRHPLAPRRVAVPAGGETLALHPEDPFEVERALNVHGEDIPASSARCKNCRSLYYALAGSDPGVCSICLHEQVL